MTDAVVSGSGPDAGVRVVSGRNLRPADPTPGMRRGLAVQTDQMWSGLAHTDPGSVSAWHHHGEHDTTLYVVAGTMRVQAAGREPVDAGAGDFVYVPRHVVHRESNPADGVSEVVVVRCGSGPVTVNVEGPG